MPNRFDPALANHEVRIRMAGKSQLIEFGHTTLGDQAIPGNFLGCRTNRWLQPLKVSGRDFSRAVEHNKTAGFSPCAFVSNVFPGRRQDPRCNCDVSGARSTIASSAAAKAEMHVQGIGTTEVVP
jgi:hypothetical protein